MNVPINEKWVIEITPDNLSLLNYWRINVKKHKSYEIDKIYHCMLEDGSGIFSLSSVSAINRQVITTEQFKEYIFNNEEIKKVNESYDYLIELFKKLGVK